MILREGMVPVILGVGLGLLVGFGVMPRLASLLFQVSPLDLPTFGGVSIFLFGIGLLACYVPARRAMRVDPMIALRYE
jgi:putative ABC transport system permease protein